MVNQMSHFRGMMFLQDGRMREYEAYDCPDVDSIHNDYQRHLPYLWTMTHFEKSKIEAWGASQALHSDGYLMEDLACSTLGVLDHPCDRTMADTTSLFIMEQYELYINTGDIDYLKKHYPVVTKGLWWMMNNAYSNDNLGLPYQLPCTYDMLGFDKYDATIFNSAIYLASLRAGMILFSIALLLFFFLIN